MKKFLIFCVLFLTCFSPLVVEASSKDDIPESLKGWIPWVIHGSEHLIACPPLHQRQNQWECSWPSRLNLKVSDKGGSFNQEWVLFDEGWIFLPGNIKQWPQDVLLSNKPAEVINRNGTPAIFADSGAYKLKGNFMWETRPEFVQIPPATALVSLLLNKEKIPIPNIDQNGRVWLADQGHAGQGSTKGKEDRLEIRVFRRITDDIPLIETIQIRLEISGKPREVLLGQGVPAGAIPISLNSALPARIEPDGKIFVQVRPGSWTISLVSRYPGSVTEVTSVSGDDPWPNEEIWVFEARNNLRFVEIEGGVPVDPQQTNIPQDWRRFPAYRVAPGESLKFIEKRRGDPDPAPDRLSLVRNIWLDFSGEGYTIQDQVNGMMTRGWRLETSPDTSLRIGQVMIDGKGQVITELNGKQGVEVRRGQIQMVADSRIDKRGGSFPIAGWDHDFQNVRGFLNLPPGWRLFGAKGIDQVPGTWIKKWSLLDLFVVLIISLSVFKLWGFRWGVLALVTLTVIYQEPLAPRFVWLHILFAVSLLKVLPQGRFNRLMKFYRNMSYLSLIIISLPFMVDQIRGGIYPQLAHSWQRMVPTHRAQKVSSPQTMVDSIEERVLEREAPLMESRLMGGKDEGKQKGLYPSKKRFLQYDPKANIQTGPGLPSWKWVTIPLQWNGPVDRTQEMKFYFLSPKANLILAFVRVILLIGFTICVLGGKIPKLFSGDGLKSSALLIAAVCTGLLLTYPGTVKAEYPTPELLKELKGRLLEKPECYPGCVDSPRMEIRANKNEFQARIEIHALSQTAIPLPGSLKEWVPGQVLLDDLPAKALFKSPDGQIWLEVPVGIHQVLIKGPLPNRASVQIALPLKSHLVKSKIQGWVLEGIHENGLADNILQLTRIIEKDSKEEMETLETGTLPPFVQVERTLILGLDWEVKTRIRRLSPGGSAVVLEVPLIDGESVTSEHVRVENRKALVNLSPRVNQTEWSSVLNKTDKITITAPETTSWVEVWRLDISPIWHVATSGIPVVHHQNQNRWLPQWRPWPGESVSIDIMRPEGVPGETFTIDSTATKVVPGQRAVNTTISMGIRSSQGGQHEIEIPRNARLQSVSINGVQQPIRQEGNKVTIPMVPGKQNVSLQIQQPEGIALLYRTPHINLNAVSVNAAVELTVPGNRWVLWAAGPRLGPAVLFWGVIIVVVFLAAGLGQVRITPLKTRHWILLGLGLTTAALPTVLIVAGWFLAMGWRRNFGENAEPKVFNAVQIGMGLLTVLAFFSMVAAIEQGLLGTPNMQISGNNSSAFLLRWYQDLAGALLPRPWILTVPMFIYRMLMMAWALWLAFAALGWLRWAWGCFSSNGIWRSGKILRPEDTHNPSHTVVPQEKNGKE